MMVLGFRISPDTVRRPLAVFGLLFWIGGMWPCLQVLPAAAGAQEREPDGLDYEHRRLEGPLSIHILRFDPRRHPVVLVRALNDGVGRETVSSMARRRQAAAAVNGGFFGSGGRYDGDPSGILKIADDWFSDAPRARAALGWRRDGRGTLIGRVQAGCSLQIDQELFPVDGLNRSRGRAETVLYNWAFHRSTLTDPGGTEVLISSAGIIEEVVAAGDSEVPFGGWVYSVGPQGKPVDTDRFKPGATARPDCVVEPVTGGAKQDWAEVDFVVGGTPVLVADGVPLSDYSSERLADRFVSQRHPRTAVGVREDGGWVVVVVDGRQGDLSTGMTLVQLAELMHQLGCRQALNLDGGGSSTFYFGGRVLNSPSDFGVERPVSEAILVLKK